MAWVHVAADSQTAGDDESVVQHLVVHQRWGIVEKWTVGQELLKQWEFDFDRQVVVGDAAVAAAAVVVVASYLVDGTRRSEWGWN